MTTNRLAKSETLVTRDIEQFVAEANRNWFVQESGKPYFVNERVNPMDGTLQKFMDRRI